ncbi:MAG TPA: hypothetical protein VM075_04800 [Anaerolineae bacterium]|nr:hypothetical protein [Anaerolineae bacterium]
MSGNPESLLMDLISADSEDDVKTIVDNHPLISKPNNWTPYGSETSVGTFLAQQESPVAALTEKIMNSIDALLVKECALRGIDPCDGSAPRTMRDAVEQFYGIKGGDYSELGETRRRELASNVWVIAEGSRRRPNLIVADKGEGQHPEDFAQTLVAIHKTAKRGIPFVQGRFHMGGTGVLPNCGEHKYQLVLSRKHPTLLKTGQRDLWGFTLVRRHPLSASDRAPWFEYCVAPGGSMFSFPGKDLNILPEGEVLSSGTYIKMFNYYLPHPSTITLDLWRELNRWLHQPALPVLLYEHREFRGRVPSKVLLGNRMRLAIDERDSVEPGFPISIVAKLGRFGRRNIEITVFREGTAKTEFTSQSEAVFFTVNGQTHASLGRSFLANRAKLGHLADYMLVHVDCTHVDPGVFFDNFMGTRDRMRKTETTEEVQTILAEELRKHEGLKELENLRREQQIMKNPKNKQFIEGVVERLVKRNRFLATYLGLGGPIHPGTQPGESTVQQYVGSRFPTFLRLQREQPVKKIPLNSYARLQLETDACNDYLSRDIDSGSLIISPDLADSYRLWNGVITMKLVPPQHTRVGKAHPLVVELTRPYDDALSVGINIEYVPPVEKVTREPGQPRKPRANSYHLPEPILVYKDPQPDCMTWEKLGWTGEDIAKVIPSGEERLDTYINMDSDALHSYLRLAKRSDPQIAHIKGLYQISIFLHSLVFHSDLSQIDGVDQAQLLPQVMKSVAKITLDLIHRDLEDET